MSASRLFVLSLGCPAARHSDFARIVQLFPAHALEQEFSMTAELIHRLRFAFTITFHYLFPQLTMGLALLIVVLKSVALKTGSEQWDRAARFWGRIFASTSLRRGHRHSHGI
jgi:hypothetical protein